MTIQRLARHSLAFPSNLTLGRRATAIVRNAGRPALVVNEAQPCSSLAGPSASAGAMRVPHQIDAERELGVAADRK